MIGGMADVTQLLDAAAAGDPRAAAELLPLVYDELRNLAAARMAAEAPGHTLQPTALVHEAFLRLVGKDAGPPWNSRGHFFAAAAEAMRRILIESARRKLTDRAGGRLERVALADDLAASMPPEELLALDEALAEFERHDPAAARLVKLRYYAGLSHQEAASALGLTRRAADRVWALARAWLYRQLSKN
jgi:RNA polymerase sigma factor (TIGR02999 family)